MFNNSDKLDGIIPALEDADRLYVIIDILCPDKKAPSADKSHARRTTQPREVAPTFPFGGETRNLGQISQKVQRKIKLHRHIVQVDIYAPMEPSRTRSFVRLQVSNDLLDPVREYFIENYLFLEEPLVPEPVPITHFPQNL